MQQTPGCVSKACVLLAMKAGSPGVGWLHVLPGSPDRHKSVSACL